MTPDQLPSETALWSSLRSCGRQFRATHHRNNKQLATLVKAAASQHWSIRQIADASTVSKNTIRKYITK